MDVSVDYLIDRLSRQLPVELPLGLVYVIGQVGRLWPKTVAASDQNQTDSDGRLPVRQFELTADDYRLICIALPEAGEIAWVTPGESVRISGHLVFDGRRAAYVLLARTLERVAPAEASSQRAEQRQVIREMLSSVKKRAQAAELAAGEMPPWVQKLAESAMQPEIPALETPSEPLPVAAEETPPLPTAVTAVPGRDAFTSELVETLSAAMDSDEDVELTPALLAKHGLAAAQKETAVAPQPAPPAPSPLSTPDPTSQNTSWLVFLMMITLLTFVVIVVTAVMLFVLN